MAKTTSQVGVPTYTTGVNLSTFTLTSGRRRQTVVLGDADEAGEELLAELPAHDSVDRGSPLKIGGYASSAVPTAVAAADRVNAWFTLNGQLATVAMEEKGYIYDATREQVLTSTAQLSLNNSAGTVISAAGASTKNKVLGVSVTNSAAGSFAFRDGAGGTVLWRFELGSNGSHVVMAPAGAYLFIGTANTLLELYCSANDDVFVNVLYVQAP